VRKNSPASTPSRCLAISPLELLRVDQDDRHESSSRLAGYTKNPKRVTNDPMEAHVIGFAMWVRRSRGEVDRCDKVIDALPGIEAPNLTGASPRCFEHTSPAGVHWRIKGNGQFDVVWKTPACGRRCMVEGARGSKDLIGDWSARSAATTTPRPTSAAVRVLIPQHDPESGNRFPKIMLKQEHDPKKRYRFRGTSAKPLPGDHAKS